MDLNNRKMTNKSSTLPWESNVPILFILSVPKLFIKRNVFVDPVCCVYLFIYLFIYRSLREEAPKYLDYILAAEYFECFMSDGRSEPYREIGDGRR